MRNWDYLNQQCPEDVKVDGYNAYYDGLPVSENPFETGVFNGLDESVVRDFSYHWAEGWYAAERDDEDREEEDDYDE